jgi:hypothetical protein
VVAKGQENGEDHGGTARNPCVAVDVEARVGVGKRLEREVNPDTEPLGVLFSNVRSSVLQPSYVIGTGVEFISADIKDMGEAECPECVDITLSNRDTAKRNTLCRHAQNPGVQPLNPPQSPGPAFRRG